MFKALIKQQKKNNRNMRIMKPNIKSHFFLVILYINILKQEYNSNKKLL